MKSVKNFVGAAVLLGSLVAAVGQIQTTNLLVNPGAESGDLTGWTQGGSSAPGVDNGTFDGGISPHTGGFDFYGHNGSYGSLSQWVPLIGQSGITAEALDSHRLLANVSFWERGLGQGTPSDDAQVSLLFLDGLSNVVATVTSGEIDAHEGSWSNFTGSFFIPVGTRSILYMMEFIRHAGGDVDSFVDDNILTVSSGRPALEILLANPNAVLSWPEQFSNFSLESAPTPFGTSWTPVPDPVHVVGNKNVVTNTLATDRQFFRLRGD